MFDDWTLTTRRGTARAEARGSGGVRATRRALIAFVALSAGVVHTNVLRANENGEEEYVAIKAGRVITVSGEEYAPGTVVIVDGKVSLVGTDIEYPASTKVIEAPNETVMPGFVLPRTRYHLASYRRSGVQGDQNAGSEVYPARMDFTDLLAAGYTTACFVPAGKGITGMACAFKTGGPDDDRRISGSAYLDVVTHFDAGSKGKELLRGALKKAKEEIEKVEKARKEWEAKQEAAKEEAEKKKEGEETPEEKDDGNGDEREDGKRVAARGNGPDNGDDGEGDQDGGDKKEEKKEPEEFKPPKIDPKHQPLVDLIQKKEGALMMVRLARASDQRHLEDVLKPYVEDVLKPSADLAHSIHLVTRHWRRESDFHYVVDRLGKREAKVVMRPDIFRLPFTKSRYNLMAKLDRAGCEVSALPWNDSRREYLRVRSRLAELVRAGLDRGTAIEALTLNPARAIGLGDRLGSLEKDKDADVIFLDGDPLDPHAKITRVMVRGKVVWTKDDD